jgi:cytochrome c biogenesis protein CcmG/thiol:disulfide interchange protein DsbE
MLVPVDELEQDVRGRRTWWRLVIAFVPAVAFVALLWVGLARTGSKATVGNRAPDFALPSVTTSETVSSEDLQGRPVVVNFWASWCIPCREEAPLLERTWRRYRDDGVVFLGVNIKDARSDARDFIEEFGVTYPNVRDVDGKLTRDFGVQGIPETFFIDHAWTFIGTAHGTETAQQQGTVVLGAISEDELVQNVELLIRRQASR